MRRYSLTVALLSIAFPSLGDESALKRCRAIAEPAARLACYDALPLALPATAPPSARPLVAVPPATPLAAPGKAPAASPASVEAQFGLEHKAPVQELQAIESYIPGLFEGWGPNYRIRLANGQVWQIADDSSRMLERRDPKVTVRRAAFGAFFLDIEGDNRSPRVRRVQ